MAGTPAQPDESGRPVAWILAAAPLFVVTTLQFDGTLRLITAGACTLFLVILVLLAHRTSSGGFLSPATLLVLALVLSLLFAAAIALRGGVNATQSFALYGQTKRLTLPVILLL